MHAAKLVEPAVHLAIAGGVATITLNRPASVNSINIELADQLSESLTKVSSDDTVQVVLLAGAGRMFCAGGDLTELAAAPDRGAYMHQLVSAAHAAVRTLAAMEKPVVAAVHGSAAGAGLSLALLADVVVAGRSAKFLTAYTSVGLTPDCGQSWLLPRATGLSQALSLTLCPRPIGAEEALALGLATTLVDDDDVSLEASRVARRLAEGPNPALGRARRLLRGSYDGFEAHLDRELVSIEEMARSEVSANLIAKLLGPSRG